MFKIKCFFLFMVSSGVFFSSAQTKNVNEGNEAPNMFNDATTRDKNAIVEAETGWWKRAALTRE
ncbi:hypothetical protein ACQX8W_14805, partial [Staphylococcus aureus]